MSALGSRRVNNLLCSKSTDMTQITIGPDTYEFEVDEKFRPAIERQLTGTTKMDSEIEANPIPERPLLLSTSIKLIRWYQRRISPTLGNRCVFEPSCSHYCELVIRELGLLKGIFLAAKRLLRCRPDAGRVDLHPLKKRS